MLTIAPFEKMHAQCDPNPALFETCNSSQALTSPSTSGWDYYWYECDAYGANPVSLGSPTPGGYTALPTGTLNQIHYYYYYAQDQGNPANNCTSGLITVMFDFVLDISSSGSLPSVYFTASGYSSSNTYSNYQWYRGGTAIIGATSSTYTATMPGDYYCVADGSCCGTRTSFTVNLGCGSNTYSNYTFSPGVTNISSKTLVLDGTITIPEDAVVNISSALIYMKPEAQIIIEKANTNDGGVLNMTYSFIYSCGTWHGITVVGADSNNMGLTKSAKCSLDYVIISDAEFGIYAFDNPAIDINHTIFSNNYRHIQIERCAGANPVAQYIQNCYFGPLMYSAPTFSGPTIYQPNPIQYSTLRPFVYLCQADDFHFVSNQYECINPPATYNQVAAIDYTYTPGYTDIFFNNENIAGDFYAGIMAENVMSFTVNGSSSIIGDIYNGINSQNVQTVTIANTDIRNNTGSKGNTGIKITECYNQLEINNCFIKNFENGIECYNQGAVSYGDITLNSIISNTYGIVIAPDCHPATGSCGTNSSHYTASRSITMFCNKVLGNDWGVVGVGDIVDQGTGPGNDWGTFFAYTIGATTSTNADLVWYNNTNTIRFYVWDSSSYIYNPQWPNSGQSISLDGNAISCCNYTNDAVPATSTYKGCRGSFIINPSSINSNISSYGSKVEISPNPFCKNLSVKYYSPQPTVVCILDITGRVLIKKHVMDEVTEINTDYLSSGLYIVNILDSKSGELINTQKLIKTTD